MDIGEIYSFYKNRFIPIYADMTIVCSQKFEEIVNGLNDAFSHVMQSYDESSSAEIRMGNLDKAYGHLVRATLDCHKIMWFELKKKIDAVYEDSLLRKYCFKMDLGELMVEYGNFEELSRQARKTELENVGKNPLASLDEWMKASATGLKLLESIDYDKVAELTKDRVKWKSKEILVGFVVGILSGIVTTLILTYIPIG